MPGYSLGTADPSFAMHHAGTMASVLKGQLQRSRQAGNEALFHDLCNALRQALWARCTGRCTGGANEAVLRMLERIGSVDRIDAFLEGVKNRKEKMFGFGHRCVPCAAAAAAPPSCPCV